MFNELKELDRKTQKHLTMHKGLHPKSHVGRLCVGREEGGRRLLSCKRTIRSEENNLGWYLKDSNENVFQGVKHVRILKFRESVSKKEVTECEKGRKLKRETNV